MRQRPCLSSLYILGISSRPAIERYDLEQIRKCDNASMTVSFVPVHFGNQLNASYQTPYVFWAWSDIPANHAMWPYAEQIKKKIMLWRSCQSSLYILGISSMPAIKRYMSCLLTMNRCSDDPWCVTLHRQIREWNNASTTVSVVLVHFGNQPKASHRTTCHVSWA